MKWLLVHGYSVDVANEELKIGKHKVLPMMRTDEDYEETRV
jgi:hypothetical protein